MAYPERRLPFDKLTTVDERVDFIHAQIVDVQIALNKLLEQEGLPTMALITKDVNLRVTLLPTQGQRIALPSPLTGRIVQIIPHFPNGCNALVDMAIGHRDTWILPHATDTFIALNDATPVLNADEPVEKGEEIWMIGRNGDGVNPHAISCAVTIIGVG
jgi:hypothetical protein